LIGLRYNGTAATSLGWNWGEGLRRQTSIGEGLRSSAAGPPAPRTRSSKPESNGRKRAEGREPAT